MTTETVRHPTPRLTRFLGEQVRVVGDAVKREATLLVAGIVLLNVVLLISAFRLGETLGFSAYNDIGALAMTTTMGALFAPLAVWKGEARFGSAPIWLMPVAHRTSALAKVAAGWVWTMALVVTLVVLVYATAVGSGGEFGSVETLLLSPAADPSEVSRVPWTLRWWQMAAVFVGPTVAYLATSALLLATPHPGRWAAGFALLLLAIAGVIDLSNDPRLIVPADRVVGALLYGRYGVDAFMTGGVETFDAVVAISPERRLLLRTGLPSLDRWLPAALLWLGGAFAAVFAAASRHRGR